MTQKAVSLWREMPEGRGWNSHPELASGVNSSPLIPLQRGTFIKVPTKKQFPLQGAEGV